MNTKVSIIIVNYKVKDALYFCLESIKNAHIKKSFEVIIVENDTKTDLTGEIKKKYKFVKYIKSPKNIGFGAGNNLGAKKAKGKYLFFLNPDTIIFPNTVEDLYKYLNNNKNTKVVSPLLLGKNRKPYLQGTKNLGFIEGIISLSFLNKLFPDNPVSRKYYLKNWDRKSLKEVDVVPGTAFMIEKKIFEKTGGFDEKFFLYFEEFDLCKRIRSLGYKMYILPQSRVIHYGGLSTSAILNTFDIFQKSRYYYFKKHYGIMKALIVEFFTRFNKNFLVLAFILFFALILRFYKLDELMHFFSDQAWFYISARDMILTGNIPLVGITSSHIWVYQGPLWTYILAGSLFVSNFNPVSGAYLTAAVGVVSVYLVYKIGCEMFSKNTGMIAALLYAFSPLVIINSRTPYHTSLIPISSILYFYFLFKWLKGDARFLPLSFLMLGVLYNLELATMVFWVLMIILLGYGFIKKEKWLIRSLNFKIIGLSLLMFFLTLIPMIIHDFVENSGYYQTTAFFRLIKIYLLSDSQLFSFGEVGTVFSELLIQNQRLVFLGSNFVAFLISAISIIYLIFVFVRKKFKLGHILVFFWVFAPVSGILLTSTPSQAYLPMFYAGIILVISLFLSNIYTKIRVATITILLIISIFNFIILVERNFLNNFPFSKRIEYAKDLIKETKGREYNLVGRGERAKEKSFTMNYEYLTWWLGHPPSKNNQKLKIYLQ